jgi:formate dehydrogenase major subunit
VRTPHVRAAHHLQLRPGTNVAVRQRHGACHRHRGPGDEAFVAERCEAKAFRADWREFVARAGEFARGAGGVPAACRPPRLRAAARLYATGGNAAIYYGLG